MGSGLGNVGHANYAAANACLDSHARLRRAHGVVACSLQWPLVGGAGMGAAAFAALAERYVSITGMAGITLEEYAACLSAQLSVSCGITLGVQMAHRSDVRELLQDLTDASQPRFGELTLQATSTPAVATATTTRAAGSVLAQDLAALAPAQQRAHVEAEVLRVVRELTGAPASSLTVGTPLMEAGIDSLATTELPSRLRELIGVPLSPTLVFEHPSPRAIAAHLLEQVSGVETVAVAAAVPSGMAAGSPLALVGVVGRWPGACAGARARDELQRACGDAMGSVPLDTRAGG